MSKYEEVLNEAITALGFDPDPNREFSEQEKQAIADYIKQSYPDVSFED